MSLLDRLLKQLDQRGLKVLAGTRPDELLLSGPAAEKTPDIVKAVKAFKPQLLERFGRREQHGPAATGPTPAADTEGER